MKVSEIISESGIIISTENVNVSDSFSEYTELHQSEHTFSLVVKAKRLGKWHVLKGLREPFRDKSMYVELLNKEFDIMFQLDHPNIVRTITKEYDEKMGPCIVTEYIDGVTLTEFIKQHRGDKSLIRKICMELLDAMAYFHSKQVIHRDLKPDNILITHNGNNVKVIDFGLSDTDYHAVLKQPAGTRKYAAPEQASGNIPPDNRADVYSFGLILIEMFTGEADISKLSELPTPYRSIAARSIETDRNKRFTKASDVQKQLDSGNTAYVWYIALGIVAIVTLVVLLRLPSTNTPDIVTLTDTVTLVKQDTVTVTKIKQDTVTLLKQNTLTVMRKDTVTLVKQDTIWETKRDTVFIHTAQNQPSNKYPVRIEKGSWEANLIDKARETADSLYTPHLKKIANAKNDKDVEIAYQKASDVYLANITPVRKRFLSKVPENSYFEYELENVIALLFAKYLMKIETEYNTKKTQFAAK